MDPMTGSLRRPLPTSELHRIDMKNNPFYWATRASQSYSFADLIVEFIGILPERKHPNVFFFTHAKQTEKTFENISPLALQSQLQLCE